MPAFIVTLGMLGIALGLGQLLSGGTSVPMCLPTIQTQIGLRELISLNIAGQQVRITPPVVIAYGIAADRRDRSESNPLWTLHVRDRLERGRFEAGRNRRQSPLIKIYALSGLLAGWRARWI